jgi:hypothetical protein
MLGRRFLFPWHAGEHGDAADCEVTRGEVSNAEIFC